MTVPMSLSTVFNNVVRRSHTQVFSDGSVRQFSTIPFYPDDMKFYLNETSLSVSSMLNSDLRETLIWLK